MLIAGCASTTLTISTDPPGAQLSEIGSGLSGKAPLRIQYIPSELIATKTNDGCYVGKGWRATWRSGATSEVTTISMCGPISNNWTFLLKRPAEHPNLATDLAEPLENEVDALSASVIAGPTISNSIGQSANTKGNTIGGQAVVENACNCKGYSGPGGPCYSGPGGAAYDGPGGPAYSGPGGPCYAGPGGSEYDGPGGEAYSGPGGPRYDGPGGDAYDGPGGPAYSGPGGACYSGPGGPCYSGPGGTGRMCTAVCR